MSLRKEDDEQLGMQEGKVEAGRSQGTVHGNSRAYALTAFACASSPRSQRCQRVTILFILRFPMSEPQNITKHQQFKGFNNVTEYHYLLGTGVLDLKLLTHCCECENLVTLAELVTDSSQQGFCYHGILSGW